MMAVVEQWTRQRSVAECVQALEAAGVPCSVYAEPADALHDPHLRSRGLFGQVADAAGPFTGVNAPWRMSGTVSRMRSPTPTIGQHQHAVLQEWLGMDDTRIGRLRDAGAFGDNTA